MADGGRKLKMAVMPLTQGRVRRGFLLLGLTAMLFGCARDATIRMYEPGQAPDTEWERAGLRFVEQLMARRFTDAHQMLALETRQQFAEQDLERYTMRLISQQFRSMDSPWVLSSIREWPAKRRNDQGIAYIQIGGDGNEAISVTVALEANELRVREIVWGRP